MKFVAVIGDMRPVGTAPNLPGFRTNHASMPKLVAPRNSMSFAQAIANTIADNKHANQRRDGRVTFWIRPRPINEKQSAVLGAIGMYMARTLARIGRPEIQPASVSRPRRIASDAQTNGNNRSVFVDGSTAREFAEASKPVQDSTRAPFGIRHQAFVIYLVRCASCLVSSSAVPCTCPVVIPSEVEESLDIG